MSPLLGLHHMTAICSNAQENFDFHTGPLGLRLIKTTVNFDDPTAYHLYYGDAVGTPGSVLTFFPYAGPQGRRGDGQVVVTHLRIPQGSLGYWADRLADVSAPGSAEGELDIADPDGLLYRLHEGMPGGERFVPWSGSPVPVEHQIRGMAGVTLQEADPAAPAYLLMKGLGLDVAEEAREGDHEFGIGDEVIFTRRSGTGFGRPGPGTVHHVAFRIADDPAQAELRERLIGMGAGVSDIRDRDYFHSIYFREPGGVLFEVATDGPGFSTDESPDALGQALRLPAMYEPRRAEIEATLPPLRRTA